MSTTCSNSSTTASRSTLNVPQTAVYGQFLTPTLGRARSPALLAHSTRKVKSASRNDRNSLQTPTASFLFVHRCSPSASPRNINDRLIPNRANTDMAMAQHLFSPMQYCSGEEKAQEIKEENAKQVTRILNFGTKVAAKPLSFVTSSSIGAKSKFKIPTKPDRVMAAPGTFLECGFQSANWEPSSNLVVALETGVYVCKINEDCNVTEIRNNVRDPENPFCHVIWNKTGDGVICGKMTGDIEICDLRHPDRRIGWFLTPKHTLRSIALEQDHLLTCGTVGNGVRIYDLRKNGGSAEPILGLKSRSGVNSLSWSPNGLLLAGGCESGLTYLWDIRHPTKEMKLLKTQEKNPVQVVDWCSWKPSILVTGSSFPRPSVCLQNTATGVLLGDFECASEVTGIEFNDQIKQVATSHHSSVPGYAPSRVIHGTESSVQLWQLGSDKLTPVLQLGQHEEGIVSMAASVNSSQLITMGGDELLCLWNWNETNSHAPLDKAGFQTPRSQLNTLNLIR